MPDAPRSLAGSAGTLCSAHDVALLDLDGVVYVGSDPVPGAPAALRTARESGLRLAFVTNNASRTPEQVVERLLGVGVPARPEEVVTSAQTAAHVLTDRLPPGARILVVGAAGLVRALEERGLVPVRSADDEPAAVVQGFGPEVGWAELAEASYAVGRGVPWVATNTDLTLPTPRGRAPGNGTLVAVVQATTGVAPVVTGKPDVAMHREAVERSSARRPLVVGDRLDTDIEGARRGGVPSLLVLSGVSDAADVVLAAPEQRPDHLAADLRGLLVEHPRVEAEPAGTARCGVWTAVCAASGLTLRRHRTGRRDDGLDALRAACVAVWSTPAPPADRAGVAAELRRHLSRAAGPPRGKAAGVRGAR